MELGVASRHAPHRGGSVLADLEVDELARLVEDLDAEHVEAAVVAPRQADGVEVVEAQAELRADERVGRRIQLARHTVGLEAENASCHKVDVVAPPCNHRVAVNSRMRNGSSFERSVITV